MSHRHQFKHIFISLFAFTLFISGVQGQEKNEQEPEAKQNEITLPYSLEEVKNSIVQIEQNEETGSGFIAKMDGENYIFTNYLNILGAEKISIKTASGQRLSPKRIELSMNRDIIRLAIDEDLGLELAPDLLEMGSNIGVFGYNKEGVLSEYFGKVSGLGADRFEVSANFPTECGGSLALNESKEVIGLASYVRYSSYSKMKQGTQFENGERRFCYRLTNEQWISVRWKQYNEKYGYNYRQADQFTKDIFHILKQWTKKPLKQIHFDHEIEDKLHSWKISHNKILGTTPSQLDSFSESAKKLADKCKTRSRQIRMLTEQRELTNYLRQDFESNARALEYAAQLCSRNSDLIYQYNF